MEKTVFSEEYRTVLDLIRTIRREAKMTQVEVAALLGETQSFVSKYERGERRLDILEIRSVVLASGSTLPDFVDRLEQAFHKSNRRK